jgi:biotin transporter BioY
MKFLRFISAFIIGVLMILAFGSFIFYITIQLDERTNFFKEKPTTIIIIDKTQEYGKTCQPNQKRR